MSGLVDGAVLELVGEGVDGVQVPEDLGARLVAVAHGVVSLRPRRDSLGGWARWQGRRGGLCGRGLVRRLDRYYRDWEAILPA